MFVSLYNEQQGRSIQIIFYKNTQKSITLDLVTKEEYKNSICFYILEQITIYISA